MNEPDATQGSPAAEPTATERHDVAMDAYWGHVLKVSGADKEIAALSTPAAEPASQEGAQNKCPECDGPVYWRCSACKIASASTQEPAAEAGEPVRTDFEMWAYTQGWRNFTRGIGGRYVVEGDLELRWIGWRACAEARPSPHPEASPPAMLDVAIQAGWAYVNRSYGCCHDDLRADVFNAWQNGAHWASTVRPTPAMPESELRAAARAAIDYWRDRSADIGGMEQRIKRLDEALARTTPQPEGADSTSAGRKS